MSDVTLETCLPVSPPFHQKPHPAKMTTQSPSQLASDRPEGIMATTSFPNQPAFTLGHWIFSPTPVREQLGFGDGGGFLLISGYSGRRWHVIKAENACHYGQVFLAAEVVYWLSPSNGNWQVQGRGYFAIKETNLEIFERVVSGLNLNENPLREASTLQYITANGPHPNVIEVTEVLRVGESMYTILPYCHGGELFSLVSRSTGLSVRSAKAIFGDVLAGISYVHALGVCHRDMSLENILLDKNGRTKIIDFGMALMVGQLHGVSAGVRRSIPPTGPCGKRRYMAPEVAMGDRAYDGFAVDVWACGIILFMMLAGFPPFNDPIPREDRRCEIIAVHGRLNDLGRAWNLPLSGEAIDLIQSCLRYDPRRRPTIDQLRSHCWFTS